MDSVGDSNVHNNKINKFDDASNTQREEHQSSFKVGMNGMPV